MGGALVEFRRLDDEEIDRIIWRHRMGEAPLDRLFDLAVFGGPPPRRAGDWPEEAWADWCRLTLRENLTRGRIARSRCKAPPELEAAWSAIMAYSHDPGGEWWLVHGLTWPGIAQALRETSRVVEYRLEQLGFRFEGNQYNRRVLEGPCLDCEAVTPAKSIRLRRCPTCFAALTEAIGLVQPTGPRALLPPPPDHGEEDHGYQGKEGPGQAGAGEGEAPPGAPS